MWDITNSIGIIIRKFQGRKKMVLWQSQSKTWEMFITTLSRDRYAHSVCCCYIYKVLSYMMKSDKLPLAQWGFHPQFTGENERRVWTGLLWESCHISCIFSPTLLSTEATKKWSNAKINTAVTKTTSLSHETFFAEI